MILFILQYYLQEGHNSYLLDPFNSLFPVFQSLNATHIISGFRHGVSYVFAVLGCQAAYVGSQSLLKMGPKGCP